MLGLVAAAAVTGCLLPQDDHLLSDFPTKPNSPPRIVGLVDPGQQFTFVDVGSGCPTKATFKVTVADPDTADLIRVHCFIDPGNETPRTYIEGDSKSGGTLGRVTSSCELPLSVGTGLGVVGEHFVKILVADGEFAGTTTIPRPVTNPDGGPALEDPSYTDDFTWVVQSRNEPCATP